MSLVYQSRLCIVHMDGVLNERTNTIHKRELGGHEFQTVCGIACNVPPDHLRSESLDQLVGSVNTTECARCFEDGGGYWHR